MAQPQQLVITGERFVGLPFSMRAEVGFDVARVKTLRDVPSFAEDIPEHRPDSAPRTGRFAVVGAAR